VQLCLGLLVIGRRKATGLSSMRPGKEEDSLTYFCKETGCYCTYESIPSRTYSGKRNVTSSLDGVRDRKYESVYEEESSPQPAL
jgi:hypothetical protein